MDWQRKTKEAPADMETSRKKLDWLTLQSAKVLENVHMYSYAYLYNYTGSHREGEAERQRLGAKNSSIDGLIIIIKGWGKRRFNNTVSARVRVGTKKWLFYIKS